MVRTREKPHLNLRRAVAHHPAHRIAVVSVSRETLHHVRRLRKLNVPPHNLTACVTRPGPPEEITGTELSGVPTWHFRPSSRPRHRPDLVGEAVRAPPHPRPSSTWPGCSAGRASIGAIFAAGAGRHTQVLAVRGSVEPAGAVVSSAPARTTGSVISLHPAAPERLGDDGAGIGDAPDQTAAAAGHRSPRPRGPGTRNAAGPQVRSWSLTTATQTSWHSHGNRPDERTCTSSPQRHRAAGPACSPHHRPEPPGVAREPPRQADVDVIASAPPGCR